MRIYTTQFQNFSIIIKKLENRKNKYEKIIQIIFIEYYNEIHINCFNLIDSDSLFHYFSKRLLGLKGSHLLEMQFKILA